MRVSDKFVLNQLAGNWILVPFGQHAVDFDGVVTLNETAKFLYENCKEEIDVKKLKIALIEEYSISEETAENAVDLWISEINEAGCIDD